MDLKAVVFFILVVSGVSAKIFAEPRKGDEKKPNDWLHTTVYFADQLCSVSSDVLSLSLIHI